MRNRYSIKEMSKAVGIFIIFLIWVWVFCLFMYWIFKFYCQLFKVVLKLFKLKFPFNLKLKNELFLSILFILSGILSFNFMPKEQEVFALFPAIIGTFFLYSAFDKSILMNDKVCYWMLNSNKKWCD